MCYRKARESACYNIFDIELLLKNLATGGLIWTLRGMQDLTDTEEILIWHYLNEYREKQMYDNVC